MSGRDHRAKFPRAVPILEFPVGAALEHVPAFHRLHTAQNCLAIHERLVAHGTEQLRRWRPRRRRGLRVLDPHATPTLMTSLNPRYTGNPYNDSFTLASRHAVRALTPWD